MKLIFQSRPSVTIAANTFVNTPVILKYENTPLLSLVQDQHIGFMVQADIYHPNGAFLAKTLGNRVFRTESGEKANINVRNFPDKYVCTLGNQELFKLSYESVQSFKAEAELYTLDGQLLKCTNIPKPELFDIKGNAIEVSGAATMGNIFKNLSVGIWLCQNGSYWIGVA